MNTNTQQSIVLNDEDIGFFNQQLTHIKAQTYEIEYAELKAASGMIFPISNEAAPTDEYIKYYTFDKIGVAKIVNSYAEDFPRADIKGYPTISNIRGIGAHYGYSWNEIQASRAKGLGIDTRRANATKRANDEKVEQITWFGDADNGLQGLFDNANVPTATVVNDGTGSTTEWVNKTSEQILRDMNNLVNGIVELTKEIEIPDTLLLPTAQYNLISTLGRSTVSDTTIKEFFLQNQSYVKNIISVPKLSNVGGNAVMVAYKMDPITVTLEIPLQYTQFAPQQQMLEYKIPTYSRCGGLIIYKPLAFSIGEGI